METFPKVTFGGELRPSQKEVVEIARKKLDEGKKRLHIVAPPGSGKTVLGLYLWAECISQPAVVLSPNSAIQAQWAARTDLFVFDPEQPQHPEVFNWVSTEPETPSSLTSLTYQSVTMPQPRVRRTGHAGRITLAGKADREEPGGHRKRGCTLDRGSQGKKIPTTTKNGYPATAKKSVTTLRLSETRWMSCTLRRARLWND